MAERRGRVRLPPAWLWAMAAVPAGLLLGLLLLVWLLGVAREPARLPARSATLAPTAELEFSGETVLVRLQGAPDATIRLNIYQVSEQASEQAFERSPRQSLLLARLATASPVFQGRLAAPLLGPRRLELVGRGWRLRGQAWFPTGEVLRMTGGQSRSAASRKP